MSIQVVRTTLEYGSTMSPTSGRTGYGFDAPAKFGRPRAGRGDWELFHLSLKSMRNDMLKYTGNEYVWGYLTLRWTTLWEVTLVGVEPVLGKHIQPRPYTYPYD